MTWLKRVDDRGSLTVELVVLTPVLVVVIVASVAFGRIVEARQQVVEAARAGAEAAAVLPSAGTAQWVGSLNAEVDLVGRGDSCASDSVSIDTAHFEAGGYVTATVACHVPLADIGFPGVSGTTTVTASATAPIDPYRSVG